MCARDFIERHREDDILVLNGDGPLLDEPTINGAYALHKSEGNAITLISALVEDTNGIGHIKRSADGKLRCIVEHKDATEEEKRSTRATPGATGLWATSCCTPWIGLPIKMPKTNTT